MTSLVRAIQTGQIPARANWGRWIADCPRCTSALQMAPQTPLFECWDCGIRAEVVWPPEEIRMSIERLLLMRPNIQDQSWDPGQTLPELMWENGLLGVFDQIPDHYEISGDSYLFVDDERIRVDMLPVTRRPEFKAIER